MRDFYFIGALTITAIAFVVFIQFGADADTFLPGMAAIWVLGVAMCVLGLRVDRENYGD